VSGAWIKIGFFVTDDNLRYQDEIHGSLFEQVEKTLELLHTKYLKAYISYDGLHRRETFLFPYAALREALLNAVVHKDYASGIPIQISVYDDKLVLWNPGVLPQEWTIQNLLGKHPSCPFNPLVANAFFRAGYIESWGRGIEKIRQECLGHGIEPPVYDSGMAGLMVTFHANPEHLARAVEAGDPTQKTSVKTLGKTQALILELLRENPEFTVPDLAIRLSKSPSAIQRGVLKLQQQGYLKRVGSRKVGYWEVINHE
jgi:ATP-dependent DNA helicase RecG